jgi:hypothetical protein
MTTTDLAQANTFFKDFAQTQVPMIGYCQPELVALDRQHCETIIPLQQQTKNHVDSLYFGALAVGADITAGFLAIWLSQQTSHYVELLFKDFQADFKKRALAATHFHCHAGEQIQNMIAETIETKDRVNQAVIVTATTPSLSNDIVAEFSLTLSLKHKPRD